MRGWWLFVGIVLLAGCGGTALPGHATPAPFATLAVHRGIGARVVANPTAITVNAVIDPAPPGTFTPHAGNRFVAVDVTLENTGAQSNSYHLFGATLRATDDRLYQAFAPTGMEPQPYFLYGAIAAGERIRGWLFFEMPATVGIAAFRYQYIADAPVVVNL